MDDRSKTVVAIGILIGFSLVCISAIVYFIGNSKVISPIPEENAIIITIISPTPEIPVSNDASSIRSIP
jgi:hypothetical protein